jgi:hypothetical protein
MKATKEIMKKSNMVSVAVAVSGVLIYGHVSAAEMLAVDFGGTYADQTINAAKRVSYADGDFDFDGTASDRAAVVKFGSPFSPPGSGAWKEQKGKSNGPIYQGLSVASLGNGTDIDAKSMMSRCAGSRIQLGVKFPGTLRLATAVYWMSDSFLCGNKSPVFLADAPESLAAALRLNGVSPSVRFLIQADGKWYISAERAYTDSFRINGAQAMWIAFDPLANHLFVDEKTPGPAVLGSTLGAITAVGLYAQTESFGGEKGSTFGFETFQVKVADQQSSDPILGSISAAGSYAQAKPSGDEKNAGFGSEIF